MPRLRVLELGTQRKVTAVIERYSQDKGLRLGQAVGKRVTVPLFPLVTGRREDGDTPKF